MMGAYPDRGLYNKYNVSKEDGPTDPKAQYFVLRMDTDPEARAALRLYADMIRDSQPRLAGNIRGNIRLIEEDHRKILESFGGVDEETEEILAAVSEVYDHITNGLISKPNTVPEMVKAAYEDHVTELVDEAVAETIDACARLLCPICQMENTLWETDPLLIDKLWRHRKKGSPRVTTFCRGHVIREAMGNMTNADVDLPLAPAYEGREVNAATKAVHDALTQVDRRLPWTTALVYDPLAVSVDWLADRIEMVFCHYFYLACKTLCPHCRTTSEYYNPVPFYDKEHRVWYHPTREERDLHPMQVCQASSIRDEFSPFLPLEIRP